MYNSSVARLKEFGKRAKVWRATSDQAFKIIKGPFDFVWIDGSHAEDQVKRDVHNWKTKLKKRSIIGGHDYQIEYIARIAKEELGEVKTGEDFTWWKEYE
jgi:hypothetical protein